MLEPSAETYRSLLKLRTVRRFSPIAVSDEHMKSILQSGRWTGSSKNRQSWTFVVVTAPAQLEALARCGDFTTPIRNSRVVIAPVRHPDGYEWDMGRASQNMMLAAAALGVGSCPITLHREDEARRVLGVPEDHGCRYVIALGYPDVEAESRGRSTSPLSGRQPLDDLVRYDRFS